MVRQKVRTKFLLFKEQTNKQTSKQTKSKGKEKGKNSTLIFQQKSLGKAKVRIQF